MTRAGAGQEHDATRPGPADTPHVRIVMATRNGAPFLAPQLASIAAQDHDNWSLFVGDDGSTDSTRDIIAAFGADHPERDITLVAGPCRGSAANFLTQAAAAVRPGDWLAFADQDDVWLPHKIARALEQSRLAHDRELVAYSSRAWRTDAALTKRRVSPRHTRPPGFGNALVQNVLSGYATLLSPAAAALVGQSARHAVAADVPFHDWWVYQLITGAAGRVVLDDEPGLLYRQHDANTLGQHRGARARLARLNMLRNRDYAGWIDRNLDALGRCEALLSAEARALVHGFEQMRTYPAARTRVHALTRLGLYRQSAAGDRVLRLLARTRRL
jgi:glycosyl transferase family 2